MNPQRASFLHILLAHLVAFSILFSPFFPVATLAEAPLTVDALPICSKDNATVHDAVVVLKAPKLEGDRLTFAVQVLEGNLAGADGPASVFIDTADFEVSALQSMFPSTNWPPSMRR